MHPSYSLHDHQLSTSSMLSMLVAVPKQNGKVYTPPLPTSINPWLARNNECLQLATAQGEFCLQLIWFDLHKPWGWASQWPAIFSWVRSGVVTAWFLPPLICLIFNWSYSEIWNFWIFSYGLKHLGILGFHPSVSFPFLIIISLLIHPKIIFGIFFWNEKYSFSSQKP